MYAWALADSTYSLLRLRFQVAYLKSIAEGFLGENGEAPYLTLEQLSYADCLSLRPLPAILIAAVQILRSNPRSVASVFRTNNKTRIIPMNGTIPERKISGSKL